MADYAIANPPYNRKLLNLRQAKMSGYGYRLTQLTNCGSESLDIFMLYRAFEAGVLGGRGFQAHYRFVPGAIDGDDIDWIIKLIIVVGLYAPGWATGHDRSGLIFGKNIG